MAPLRLPKSRPRSPSPSLSVQTVAVVVLRQLRRLQILAYILMGASAAFSAAFLIWKLGSLFQQFTLGRILEERKPVETRYVKTWYGWIPQDRYNARRRKWKNLYSIFWNWLSWDDSDDYSKIWWDSHSGGDQMRSKRKIGSSRRRSIQASLRKRKLNHTVADAVATERDIPDPSSPPNTYILPHRPSLAYLTFPFHLKRLSPATTVDKNGSFLAPVGDGALQGRIPQPEKASPEYPVLMGRVSTHAMTRKTQQLRYLRNWATRLEMGSLQSVLPHQSGILGRPGSPMTPDTSSGSGLGPDSGGISPSDTRQIRQEQIEPFSKALANRRCEVLDVELRFMDTLDRHLEWLLNECQPGQRGFKFPILPKNWINNQKWLVYVNPCGASVEYMRRYAQCDFGTADYKESNRRRSSAPVSRRRVRADSIESWRAAINKVRLNHDIAELRSVEVFLSSAEDVFESVIDPADWMLRRPPQGFEMPNRQRKAYYYGGMGRWAKLEEWQMGGDTSDESANTWKNRMDVTARLEESRKEFRHNHAEITNGFWQKSSLA
ncbi:hypothetical protein TSTA_024810 [Talaromyces stipitatus ATCC 10500]|uniref:Uncharacterized protein n=1 Tax=Talaromyces stipitatus (strain ATCC 10500 / CBS 375.48 / QM 6759 / NRRL 1006) TaxID=441959 RepID=B8M4G4_TALSN|nr:uncharacterized protein TSTA_024810 [Talaromyces stipitatus ATCC 10500]EED19159.1 hypothetical protein TSTA_024810 [Talaromyces stipitatus ATCC 10500]